MHVGLAMQPVTQFQFVSDPYLIDYSYFNIYSSSSCNLCFRYFLIIIVINDQ